MAVGQTTGLGLVTRLQLLTSLCGTKPWCVIFVRTCFIPGFQSQAVSFVCVCVCFLLFYHGVSCLPRFVWQEAVVFVYLFVYLVSLCSLTCHMAWFFVSLRASEKNRSPGAVPVPPEQDRYQAWATDSPTRAWRKWCRLAPASWFVASCS